MAEYPKRIRANEYGKYDDYVATSHNDCYDQFSATLRERASVDEIAYLLFISKIDFVADHAKNRKTWEALKAEKHNGDCTDECHTCMRCMQDSIIEIATILSNHILNGLEVSDDRG